MKTFCYTSNIEWTGNRGSGTSGYTEYSRDYLISLTGKPDISGSSDPAFMGDPEKHNPEELFLSSISACHMLWYLHLCADQGIIVTAYTDYAEGYMKTEKDSSGRFISVTLRPQITITDQEMSDKALKLHQDANRMCFIANSLNFRVMHHARIYIAG